MCAISRRISFLTSGNVGISNVETTASKCTRMIYNLDSTADSREQSPPREIAAHCNGSLPIPIQFVYSFQIFVPVVQRIEQGFPKAKRQSGDKKGDTRFSVTPRKMISGFSSATRLLTSGVALFIRCLRFFLAEFLESGIGAQRVPGRMEP